MDGNISGFETARPIDVAASQQLLDTLNGVLELEQRLLAGQAQPQDDRSLLVSDLAEEMRAMRVRREPDRLSRYGIMNIRGAISRGQ